ncbi:MFS sugar transporter [Zalerion maritima]|uniref:MFS sugar transporter n=1 Tax=Zalerion maritima TaxID=339359 RepID=A0AAD5RWR7_9PEZI|nr:MFS sugar transporter [Zalerion maritima]
MLGFVAGIAFYNVPDFLGGVVGLNWRLMMLSPAIPAVIVMALIFTCAESPRWLASKGRGAKAYRCLCRLRCSKIQAARDLFMINAVIEAERSKKRQRGGKENRIAELWAVRRNRNAMVATCGINVIAYYSSEIFLGAGFSDMAALGASLGFGTVNIIFGIPGILTIDKYGRRFLLLVSFPVMALFMFLTGMAFSIPPGISQIAAISTGIYLFGAAYSPGAGPVPFTYSAEAYPQDFFNAILALTFPRLLAGIGPQGAFTLYAALNILGWVAVLLFVPETKGRSLEELEVVFDVGLRDIARYNIIQAKNYVLRCRPRKHRKHITREEVA